MISTTFTAMGTTVVIHAKDEHSIGKSREMFERYERRFSRFRSTSELSGINRAGERGVAVSQDMRQILAAATELQSRTEGLVDIGVGAAVRDWGYDTTYSDVTDLKELPDTHSIASWDFDGTLVRLLGGAYLDLGGIAKGWTCDRVVEAGFAAVRTAQRIEEAARASGAVPATL